MLFFFFILSKKSKNNFKGGYSDFSHLTELENIHVRITEIYMKKQYKSSKTRNHKIRKQEGHDGPVSLHWLICKFPSYQTLHYFGITLKHQIPKKD